MNVLSMPSVVLGLLGLFLLAAGRGFERTGQHWVWYGTGAVLFLGGIAYYFYYGSR